MRESATHRDAHGGHVVPVVGARRGGVIGAVVLAAGQGTRFGGPKVLAQHKGIELVRHVVDRLVFAGVFDIVVTAGEHRVAIEAALAGSPARVVSVADPTAGLSASLNTGVSALADECRVFVVALGDQPLIDAQLIGRLRAAWEGRRGPPALRPSPRGGRSRGAERSAQRRTARRARRRRCRRPRAG